MTLFPAFHGFSTAQTALMMPGARACTNRQIDAGSALATDYENKGFEAGSHLGYSATATTLFVQDLLRLPVLRQQAERLSSVLGSDRI